MSTNFPHTFTHPDLVLFGHMDDCAAWAKSLIHRGRQAPINVFKIFGSLYKVIDVLGVVNHKFIAWGWESEEWYDCAILYNGINVK